MPKVNNFVLDSYAMIGFLENEPFADRIETLLLHAQKGDINLYFHAIHLGEVYYITLREQGQHLADLAYSRIKSLHINILDLISENLLKKAGTYKASFSISYADAFAAALAAIYNCPLLSGDQEFRSLEKEGLIQVEWL